MTTRNERTRSSRPSPGGGWVPGAAALTLLLASACVAPRPCGTPPPFYLSLRAAEQLNKDDHDRSTPIIVHVLQLKEITGMDVAGFREVWEREDGRPAPFSRQLRQETELVVAPGKQVARWIPREPDARYVVAVTKVRRPLGRTWYSVYQLHPVPEGQCVDQPLEQDRRPSSVDELLYFQLEEYQIRYRRPDLFGASEAQTGPGNGRHG